MHMQLEISPNTSITFLENEATESGAGIYVEFPPIRYSGPHSQSTHCRLAYNYVDIHIYIQQHTANLMSSISPLYLCTYVILPTGLWWTSLTDSASFSTKTRQGLTLNHRIGRWDHLQLSMHNRNIEAECLLKKVINLILHVSIVGNQIELVAVWRTVLNSMYLYDYACMYTCI